VATEVAGSHDSDPKRGPLTTDESCLSEISGGGPVLFRCEVAEQVERRPQCELRHRGRAVVRDVRSDDAVLPGRGNADAGVVRAQHADVANFGGTGQELRVGRRAEPEDQPVGVLDDRSVLRRVGADQHQLVRAVTGALPDVLGEGRRWEVREHEPLESHEVDPLTAKSVSDEPVGPEMSSRNVRATCGGYPSRQHLWDVPGVDNDADVRGGSVSARSHGARSARQALWWRRWDPNPAWAY